MSENMKIAEVSEKYGIPADTLRYYEREGVIPKIKRSNGGIREYSDDDCEAIEFAQCLRAAGFTVEDIVEYRRLFAMGDSTFQDRLDLFRRKKEDLIAQREAIDRALDKVDFKIGCYERAIRTGKLTWDPLDE